jgi:VWFA-related protein
MQLRLFCLLALPAILAPAQTPAPQAQPAAAEVAAQDAGITFSSKVNEVLVPVVVRDKSGKPIPGLTKEDFTLSDKGRPQIISRIAVETSTGKPITPTPSAPPVEKAAATRSGDASAPEVTTPTHFVAFFFDDVHLEIPDLIYSRQAAEKYLNEGLKPTDRAAVFTTSGQNSLEFTDDIAKLKETIGQIRTHPVARHIGQNCPDISFYMADYIINKHDTTALTASEQEAYVCLSYMPPQTIKDTESTVLSEARTVLEAGKYESRIALLSLRDLVRRMSTMPGQRLILVVSPGFLNLAEDHQDESDVIDRAIKANVTVSAIDARGLYTDTPDISKRTISLGAERVKEQYNRESARASADVMAELADATGGTFFQNSNDLTTGFRELAAVPEIYYILAFSPQNLKLDGSYHGLKVTLRNRAGSPLAGASLRARRGYYAPYHLANADEQAKEEISEALFSRDDLRDIPVEFHTQFFKPTDDEAQLSVITRIDVRKLKFRKADGRNGDELVVVAGLFDRNGNFLQSISKKVSMRLKDETLAGKLDGGIAIHADFKTAPGRYIVRLVVRDAEGQMMAARSGGVEIP